MTREELKTQLAASSAGKNVSKVAAVLIGLGSLAIASAIQPMTPISFFGVLFVGAIPTILLWLKGDDHNAIIVKAWSDYYANSKWKTAGRGRGRRCRHKPQWNGRSREIPGRVQNRLLPMASQAVRKFRAARSS